MRKRLPSSLLNGTTILYWFLIPFPAKISPTRQEQHTKEAIETRGCGWWLMVGIVKSFAKKPAKRFLCLSSPLPLLPPLSSNHYYCVDQFVARPPDGGQCAECRFIDWFLQRQIFDWKGKYSRRRRRRVWLKEEELSAGVAQRLLTQIARLFSDCCCCCNKNVVGRQDANLYDCSFLLKWSRSLYDIITYYLYYMSWIFLVASIPPLSLLPSSSAIWLRPQSAGFSPPIKDRARGTMHNLFRAHISGSLSVAHGGRTGRRRFIPDLFV